MNITIKLEDPKSCGGCPCLQFEREDGFVGCNIDYWSRFFHNEKQGIMEMVEDNYKIIRPQRCIEERGL